MTKKVNFYGMELQKSDIRFLIPGFALLMWSLLVFLQVFSPPLPFSRIPAQITPLGRGYYIVTSGEWCFCIVLNICAITSFCVFIWKRIEVLSRYYTDDGDFLEQSF